MLLWKGRGAGSLPAARRSHRNHTVIGGESAWRQGRWRCVGRINPSPTDAARSPSTTEDTGSPVSLHHTAQRLSLPDGLGPDSKKQLRYNWAQSWKKQITRATCFFGAAHTTKGLQDLVHCGFEILLSKAPPSVKQRQQRFLLVLYRSTSFMSFFVCLTFCPTLGANPYSGKDI